MKTSNYPLFLGASLVAVSAFAADSADLSVKGLIRPAACTPTLTGNGVVDFGAIPAGTLSDTIATTLPTKTTALTITCAAATKVGVMFADNRAGTENATAGDALIAMSSYRFGLGRVGGKSVGAYTVGLGPTINAAATGDSASVATIYAYANEASVKWAQVGEGFSLAQPSVRMLSWAPIGTVAPGAYKTIVQPLKVTMAIGKTSELPPLTQDLALDGSATISIVYL